MLVQVSPSLNIYNTLTYNFPGDPALLKPGIRVVIPVGNRPTLGWITETHSQYKGRVKNIFALVNDDYVPDKCFLEFTKAVADLYFASVGNLLDSSLPPQRKPISSLYFKNPEEENRVEKFSRYSSSQMQQLSKKGTIQCFYKTGSIQNPRKESPDVPVESLPTLPKEHLFLAGYDRNTYYAKRIRECLSQGKSVLVTAPDNFRAANLKNSIGREGIEANIYNSSLSPKERTSLWNDYVLRNKTGVIVGGLSAVLLPVQNLGLIICDAAGNSNYKHPPFSVFNVNVLAKLRAQYCYLPFVEGYASPTVQAIHNSTQIEIRDERDITIPVNVISIKKDTRGIPNDLQEMMNSYTAENKKLLILLNRKEGANFLYCHTCQKPQKCPSCSGYIDVEGEKEFQITCRSCKEERKPFNLCPKCNSPLSLVEDISLSSMKKFIKNHIAETGITSISSEALKEDHIDTVLHRINNSKIVIATPVLVNPVFKNIFDAIIYFRPESFFNLERYDAAEKIFSIISELREMIKIEGNIDVYSTFHFHYAMKLINDETAFFQRELKYREWFLLPPFFNVYHIEVKDTELRKLASTMRKIFNRYKETINIKNIYLTTRQPLKGKYKYKGIIEAHAWPEEINKTSLFNNRNIKIHLEMT